MQASNHPYTNSQNYCLAFQPITCIEKHFYYEDDDSHVEAYLEACCLPHAL